MDKKCILDMAMRDYWRGNPNSVRLVNEVAYFLNKWQKDLVVGDVVKLSKYTLQRLRNIGKRSIGDLENHLENDGLHLGMTEEEINAWRINNDTPVEQRSIASLADFVRETMDKIGIKSMCVNGVEIRLVDE